MKEFEVPASGLARPLDILVRGPLPMHTVPRRWVTLVLPAALFALAIWALRRELAAVEQADLLRHLRGYDWPRLLLAVGCTAASFLLLGAVEVMALRHAVPEARGAVPRRAALAIAFIANAISQSVGLALLTGTAVRVRAYARYGLGAAAAGRVSAFVTLTAWLGLLATAAAALLSAGPAHVGGTSIVARPAGVALALLVLAYLASSVIGARPEVGRGRWRIVRPTPALAAGQVILSTLDWLLTVTVLFWLLPPALAMPYAPFVRACLLAFVVGVASHVPGGLGVFEAVLLGVSAGLVPAGSRAAVAASLVMFRVVYYVVPLAGALALAAVAELRRQADGVRAGAAALPSAVPAAGPRAHAE